MDTKFCTRCKEEKPKDKVNFPIHNKKTDGLDSWCRKCRAVYRSEVNRGKFRGMLCNHCNRGLGNFKDSIDNLELAIKYLKDRDK